MRLLYVHERYGALAGAEANAVITASALQDRGHSIGIIHGPATGKDEKRWNETFTDRFPLDSPSPAHLTQQALARFQPDAVYVHKLAQLDVIETLVQSNIPLVRMVHDHDIYCMRSYKYSPWSRKICTRAFSPACIFPCGAFLVRDRSGPWPLRFVSYSAKQKEIALNRRFHRMIVVTEYMKQELLRNGFQPEKIQIIPPIPRMGDPNVQSSFGPRNLILYVGQIIRGKGVDILLKSLALLQVPFECLILGEGSHKAECEALSKKLGLQDRVRFAGFIPQADLKSYFREASLVAISSVWPEPIATVGLEVMRYGLPVVAFDAGGIRDWLIDGHNGFLVPWMDQQKFAERVEQLLRDKSLARQMGEHGRHLSLERYDFSDYISRLEQLFSSLTLPNPTQPCPSSIGR